MRARSRLPMLLLCALAACDYDASAPLDADAAESDASADASVADSLDATEEDGADIDARVVDAPTDAPPDAPTDAAVDAPIDAILCLGQVRCTGDIAQQCNASGNWIDLPACTSFCGVGGCVSPPSCSSIGNCAGGSCCAARFVPGGMYYRSYDGVSNLDMTHPATVSPFVLDRYEVSVGRFRRFVSAYPGSLPTSGGQGRNPHVASDGGWNPSWTAMMPSSKVALEAGLATCTAPTYTTTTSANDDLPVNCVSWYLAYAFCVWDGGRLPSEAEWNRAASGGAEQRVYPWSAPATDTTIDAAHAVYSTTGLGPVGSHPQGNGLWGHADLAGNAQEWIADWYSNPYTTSACQDCQNTTSSSSRVLRSGQYTSGPPSLTASARSSTTPTSMTNGIGVRCVHDQ